MKLSDCIKLIVLVALVAPLTVFLEWLFKWILKKPRR